MTSTVIWAWISLVSCDQDFIKGHANVIHLNVVAGFKNG